VEDLTNKMEAFQRKQQARAAAGDDDESEYAKRKFRVFRCRCSACGPFKASWREYPRKSFGLFWFVFGLVLV
jgi:hypothetical protein